jgi:RNA polymerase sigma-70 factor (ECF subfamily)
MNTPQTQTILTFETLMENHNQEIFAYLWRTLPTAADAEDCLQETFLRAFKAYPRLKHHDNLRAWLYKIASNAAKDHFRQIQRRDALQLKLSMQAPTAHVQEELHISLHELQAAVMALPHKQRSALILSKYQGLSYEEISQTLSISQEAARANVYQALKKLRQQFNLEETDDE